MSTVASMSHCSSQRETEAVLDRMETLHLLLYSHNQLKNFFQVQPK